MANTFEFSDGQFELFAIGKLKLVGRKTQMRNRKTQMYSQKTQSVISIRKEYMASHVCRIALDTLSLFAGFSPAFYCSEAR